MYMNLIEKIGLGLHPLKNYGFLEKKEYGRVYYEKGMKVFGNCKSINARHAKIRIFIKGDFIRAQIRVEGLDRNNKYTYEQEYEWNTSVEEVLYNISKLIENEGLKIEY